MPKIGARTIAVPAAVGLTLGWPLRRSLLAGLKLGLERWRSDAPAAAADIAVSSVGQLFFWTVGQDFIGFGMVRKWGPGLGHKLAPQIQRRLPQTAAVAWMLKAIEIASDATKMPVEGYLYREVRIVPDAVACAVTQPAWSFIEVVEKLTGVINHPERVHTPDQVADSISSIYGTWSRHGLGMVMLYFGPQMRSRLGNGLERRLRR